jgi:tetratricopeptide (TPR) repeat protein
MKALFIAFFVGTCCFLSACKGHNNIEQHKETVAVKTDRIPYLRFRGEETVPSLLVRTANGESHFFDEEIDRLIQQNTKFQLELADLGATSEAVVYKNLGVSCLEQGKLDKAVVAFRKAVQIAPRFIEAHYLLADVYSLKGEGILSRKSLNQAMVLEGSYIIDIRVTEETHTIIIELPQSTVIESTGPIQLPYPPEFFQGPIKRMDAPQR